MAGEGTGSEGRGKDKLPSGGGISLSTLFPRLSSTCSTGTHSRVCYVSCWEVGGSHTGLTFCVQQGEGPGKGPDFTERWRQPAGSACSAPSASHLALRHMGSQCKFLLKALLLYSLTPAPDHHSFICGVLKLLSSLKSHTPPKIKRHSTNLLTSPENTERLRKKLDTRSRLISFI